MTLFSVHCCIWLFHWILHDGAASSNTLLRASLTVPGIYVFLASSPSWRSFVESLRLFVILYGPLFDSKTQSSPRGLHFITTVFFAMLCYTHQSFLWALEIYASPLGIVSVLVVSKGVGRLWSPFGSLHEHSPTPEKDANSAQTNGSLTQMMRSGSDWFKMAAYGRTIEWQRWSGTKTWYQTLSDASCF